MHGVAVFGVTGRMGRSLVRSLQQGDAEAAGLALSGALAGSGSEALGRDAAGGPTAAGDGATGVRVTGDADDALHGAAVAVDFSRADGVAAHAAACVRADVPLVVGTTGLDAETLAALTAAAASIAVLIAPNTSVGVGVMTQLVRQAALSLGAGFDVEIAEAHHRMKRDAPSGTALALGRAVAAARGEAFDAVAVFDRHGAAVPGSPAPRGEAPRGAGSIGFSVVRGGDIVGEHTVVFAGAGERVEITHRATDRAIFARGALRAAAWLVGRPAGLYGMENVLGLR